MADNLKTKTVSGLIWNGLDAVATKGIQFVFTIIIARILLPADFGLIAMLGIFLAIAQTLVDSGFGSALIRKQDRTEDDFNTVFYFNIAISILCFLLLWVSAPLIARFYDIPALSPITRATSTTILINALCNNQWTKLSIEINFRTKAIISVVSVLVSGCFGLFVAYKGGGAWALVAQSIALSAAKCVLLWILVRWTPKLRFSWKSFKEMFSFGSKMLASGILRSIYGSLHTLVIGKVFTAKDLGEYSRANSFAELTSSFITNAVQSVSFPVLSTLQNETDRLLKYYRKLIKSSAFIIFPACIGLCALAQPAIQVLLTDKWLGCVKYLQILCFAHMLHPVLAINGNILIVLGRSDYYLRADIIQKCLGVALLCATIPFGVAVVCAGQVVLAFITLFVNTYYSRKLINYGILLQLKDLLPIFMASISMGVVILLICHFFDNAYLQLSLGFIAGVAFYFIVAKLLHFEELETLMDVIVHKD